MDEDQVEALVRLEDERCSRRQSDSYKILQAVVQHAAESTLPRRIKRRTQSWFEERRDILLPLVEERNVALARGFLSSGVLIFKTVRSGRYYSINY